MVALLAERLRARRPEKSRGDALRTAEASAPASGAGFARSFARRRAPPSQALQSECNSTKTLNALPVNHTIPPASREGGGERRPRLRRSGSLRVTDNNITSYYIITTSLYYIMLQNTCHYHYYHYYHDYTYIHMYMYMYVRVYIYIYIYISKTRPLRSEAEAEGQGRRPTPRRGQSPSRTCMCVSMYVCMYLSIYLPISPSIRLSIRSPSIYVSHLREHVYPSIWIPFGDHPLNLERCREE